MILEKENLNIINKDENIEEFQFIFKNNVNPFFCKKMKSILNSYKSYINNYDNWDYIKKISNNYELINKNGSRSISNINPISRSFYKFIELINDFNLLSNKLKFRYAALAEGPGGFIEAFIYLRNKMFLGKYDYIQCMTLSSYNKDVPNWIKAKKIFNNSNIKYCYGKDGTGDLYNTENILNFREIMGGNTADIVSGDGGFDYSKNFNKQEEDSYKLILSEIICAYGVNSKNGHFVLKIFDIFMLPTIQLIYLLSIFYKQIILVKPNTSRPANSEKYIVCKFFKGFKQSIFDNLIKCLKNWDDNKFLHHIENINIPRDFIHYISKFNCYIIKKQIKNILKTIFFIKSKIECEELTYVNNIQNVYAIEWCNKYKIPINNIN